MKRLLLAAAGAVVLASGGVALAQNAQPPAPPPGPEGHGPGMGPGMGPDMGPGRPWEHGAMHGGMHGGMRHWARMMMENGKAAHFHFARGDAVVDIKCAADENTKACVDAAGALLDKLNTK